MFRAVVFDIGSTLVEYNKPLNWSALYRPALEHIAKEGGYALAEKEYQHGIDVLTKYNTRIHPREYEVSSTLIFLELIKGTCMPIDDLEQIKHLFYSFFRREVTVYPEVERTLAELTARNILLGTLSDVAYGMDNPYVLEDIASIIQYIPYPYTSNDVGYRKPNIKGLQFLAEKMQVDISEMIFVGDEEKDILCANNAGAYAVLINREADVKEYGQKKEIHSLGELLDMVDKALI